MVSAREINAGHVLCREDIAIKSPGGGGFLPYMLDQIIGKKIVRAKKTDDEFHPDDFMDEK